MYSKMKIPKILILSVGGSIIVPDNDDYVFLKNFKKLLQSLSKKYRIVIVCGGGRTARNYIQALEKEGISKYDQNIIGIYCTRLNALLLTSFLGANKEIPTNMKEFYQLLKKNKILVTGGGLEKFEIGSTSDGTTAVIARRLNTKMFINLTNVNGLYDRDPRKFRNAKLIRQISHEDFEKIMKRVKEKPGQHFILDSLATRIILMEKIKAIILNGHNLKNLENFLQGKRFVGTVIG